MAAAAATSAAGTLLEERAAWQRRLDASLECVRTLLAPGQAKSRAWRPVPLQTQGQQQQPPQTPATQCSDQAARSSSAEEQRLSLGASSSRQRLDDQSPARLASPEQVQVHRRTAKRSVRDEESKPAPSAPLLPPGCAPSADIFRAVCHVPVRSSAVGDMGWESILTSMQALLATPECRPVWDEMVEDASTVEELDATTRITRTIFKLGWPASQRDAIAIQKTQRDANTLIDVSTSLPRSPDAPAYLRPAPPYVRSHLNLFAWCVERSRDAKQPSLKISVFWSWDLRGAWLGMPAGGLGARLPAMLGSLISHVRSGDATRVPFLSHFGTAIEIVDHSFEVSRDLLSIRYQVISEAKESGAATDEGNGNDNSTGLEWLLPSAEGWDIHIEVKPLEAHRQGRVHWSSQSTQLALRDARSSSIRFALQHSSQEERGEDVEQSSGMLRGTISIQRIAASQDVRVRVNDEPQEVRTVESLDGEGKADETRSSIDLASASSLSNADDSASISGLSLQSEGSSGTSGQPVDDIIKRATTPSNAPAERNGLGSSVIEAIGSPMQAQSRAAPDRSQVLASIVRRNYIYFTSLLQEPEAKWKAYSDSRGVTITHLDSIDPTLVVYRAEATFVGVTVWDLFAAIGNPGVKTAWDKGVEESRLIHDVGDASRLWWTRTRGTWPVSARDSVTVETSYKSPNSVHLFAFSTDDHKLFPAIPSPEPGAIRTQIDLRGWSIESLSPTTVHVTLIEQSDPKGWTSKSAATPAAMTSAVAGVGDFVIRNGSPPIVTRLLGAKLRQMKYEHDKGTFRVEYDIPPDMRSADDAGNVECEIRCDIETWGPSIDVVIDPPPINVSCLRRHKLSPGGSGLWLTIEQPSASLEDDASRVAVRRASTKERGVVLVNGARIKVDIDELSEDEVAQLREKKRTKPQRVPLDLVSSGPRKPMTGSNPPSTPVSRTGTPATGTKGAVQPALPSSQSETEKSDVFSDERPRQPMTCALDVLFLLRRIHAERSPDPSGTPAGWTFVSQRGGLFTRRKMMHSISPTVAVQRGDKVVEGLTAEDLLSVVATLGCRRLWDDKVESTMPLDSFGNGASTGFLTTKASFPFRGRAFHLASLTARSGTANAHVNNPTNPAVYFHASASYSVSDSLYAPDKLNPMSLPLGRVLIDGWILETLDPYSSTLNYQIPSTRVTHLIAVDYAGSLPTTVNAVWNTQLARSIVAVEEYVKRQGALPALRRPPSCFEVRGDGREDDQHLVWTLEDDRKLRPCTLLTSSFDPASRECSVLFTIESDRDASGDGLTTPLAVPFPRRAALSTASTTKGHAVSAALHPQPSTTTIATTGAGGSIGDTSAASDGLTVSRTTSTASLRNSGMKSRPSLNKLDSRRPEDLVVVDIELDLKQYEQGYEVIVSSELQKSAKGPTAILHDNEDAKADAGERSEPGSSASMASHVLPLRAAHAASQALPLSVTAFDLPPSAVLAATLDPAARPKKHLVRVSLPTSTFLDARENPLQGPDIDDAPAWFRDLRDRGACARVTLRPLTASNWTENGTAMPSNGDEDSELDSQQVPVFVLDKRIPVTHVNQTSAMLQRESEQEQPLATLDRATATATVTSEKDATTTAMENRLPALLQRPVASALELHRQPDNEAADDSKTPSATRTQTQTITPSTSSAAMHDPDTPTPMLGQASQLTKTDRPAAKSASSTASASTPASAASAQIMSILNTYPLSRLGASTAVSTTVANGGVFSKRGGGSSEEGGEKKDGTGEKEVGEAGRGNSIPSDRASTAGGDHDAAAQSMPGHLIAQTEQLRQRLVDVRFRLSTLVLVALIAFLVGSLVRSLLAPADFVLVDRLHGQAAIRAPAQQAAGADGAAAAAAHKGAHDMQAAALKEVRKLFEGQRGGVGGSSSSGSSGGGGGGGDTGLATGAPPSSPEGSILASSVAWRELKRLVEIRNVLGMQWDLVIAAARR